MAKNPRTNDPDLLALVDKLRRQVEQISKAHQQVVDVLVSQADYHQKLATLGGYGVEPSREQPKRRAMKAAEAAEYVGLARSTFHDLVKAGVFGKPMRDPKRPRIVLYDVAKLDAYLDSIQPPG